MQHQAARACHCIRSLAKNKPKRLNIRASDAEPTTHNPQHITHNPQPATHNPQPITHNPQPATPAGTQSTEMRIRSPWRTEDIKSDAAAAAGYPARVAILTPKKLTVAACAATAAMHMDVLHE